MQVFWNEAGKQLHQPGSDRHGQEGADERKEEGFAEELGDELTAGPAHGLADTDLLCSLGGLCRGKVDKIDAAEAQQENGYCQQSIKGGFAGLALSKAVIGAGEVDSRQGLEQL